MTLAQAKDAVKQAAHIDSIKDICLEGGEPFLFYPIMLKVARYARELKLNVSIVTNSYFATCVEDAVHWLRPLAEMGISSISVSNDEFHSGTDPRLTEAQNAVKAAEILGIKAGTIRIDQPCITSDPQKPGEPILGGSVRFRGRAVEKLIDDKLPKQAWDSFDECPDENWDEIGRLHLDPYGNLYPCQGVVVGNLNNQSLTEVIENYNPATHPIIAPLYNGGPAALIREFNLPLGGKYHDACHLCFLARKMLREEYSQYLAPVQVYE